MDPYAPDAPGRGLDDLEHRAVVGRRLLAGLRNRLSQRHAEPCDGGAVLTDRKVEVEVAVDLAHRGPALNQDRTGGLPREVPLGNVLLAHDAADKLLDQVLGRDKP